MSPNVTFYNAPQNSVMTDLKIVHSCDGPYNQICHSVENTVHRVELDPSSVIYNIIGFSVLDRVEADLLNNLDLFRPTGDLR